MADQQSSSSNGNGAAKNQLEPDLKHLLQQYLDSLVNIDESSASSVDSDGRLHMQYQGQYRTTTGIVKIMRESGKTESADLLEELRQTQESARQLLDKLQALHKHKTGAYHIPSRVKQSSGT